MKEEFMILKAEETLIEYLNTHSENALVVQGACDGLRLLVTSDDPRVLPSKIMTAIAALSLRSPANATKAVEAGSVDLAVEMMEKHSMAAGVQRQSCQMIRNLAVRNPENRPIIIEKGIETLIRAAKARHIGCKDAAAAAAAALRDLGFDDYL